MPPSRICMLHRHMRRSDMSVFVIIHNSDVFTSNVSVSNKKEM